MPVNRHRQGISHPAEHLPPRNFKSILVIRVGVVSDIKVYQNHRKCKVLHFVCQELRASWCCCRSLHLS